MKKWLALLLALAMCLAMTMTAFAEEDSAGAGDGVTVNVAVTDDGAAVKLQADTAVTDGLVTITYDPDEVSISEKDVIKKSGVAECSVNAENEGEVVIAWVSKVETTGVLFRLNFTKIGDSISDDAFSASGTAYTANGIAVTVYLATGSSEDEADKSALQDLYDECLTLDETAYTEGSWDALQVAMTAARAVLEDADADQASVDAACEDLAAAMDGLEAATPDEEDTGENEPGDDTQEGGTAGETGDNEPGGDTQDDGTAGETGTVDKAALEDLESAGETLEEDSYTEESWNAFQEALEAAKEVLEDPNATAEDVAQALENLQNATAALEAVTSDEETSADSGSAKTGDNASVLVISIVAVIALCGLLVLYTEKRRAGK